MINIFDNFHFVCPLGKGKIFKAVINVILLQDAVPSSNKNQVNVVIRLVILAFKKKSLFQIPYLSFLCVQIRKVKFK